MKLRLIWRRHYPHATGRVWRALTERDLLAQWLLPNDFAPIVGHEFTFMGEPRIRCRVTRIDAPSHLEFTWDDGEVESLIAFALIETTEGTRLDLTMTAEQPRAWLEEALTRIDAVLDNLIQDQAGHLWLISKKEDSCPSKVGSPTTGASSRI